MDQRLYDEFGNYIGGELDDDEASEEEEEKEDAEETGGGVEVDEEVPADRQVVLHEDKKYYPEASEVYPEVETILQEYDTQPITAPILAPKDDKDFDLLEKNLPNTVFDYDFLAALMEHPHLIRNVALIGAMHHGKTSLMDTLVMSTHPDVKTKKNGQLPKYTDSRKDEQGKEISLKASPMSLVLPDSNDKSYLVNLMDT